MKFSLKRIFPWNIVRNGTHRINCHWIAFNQNWNYFKIRIGILTNSSNPPCSNGISAEGLGINSTGNGNLPQSSGWQPWAPLYYNTPILYYNSLLWVR